MFNIYELFYGATAVIGFTLYVQIVDGGRRVLGLLRGKGQHKSIQRCSE